MPGKLDAVLKLVVILGVAISSAAISYYYLIYLPDRDARAEFVRQLEKTQAEEKIREESERADAKERQEIREKERANSIYRTCLLSASVNYSDQWDGECKSRASVVNKRHSECMAVSKKSDCDFLHKRMPEKDCSLPTTIANTLNASLEKNKERCLQEYKAGIR